MLLVHKIGNGRAFIAIGVSVIMRRVGVAMDSILMEKDMFGE